MATPAKLLKHRKFDGEGRTSGYSVVWPGFTFPAGGPSGANPAFSKPVVDGYGWGFTSRGVSEALWRGLAGAAGVRNPRINLKGKWSNAGFSGMRGLGILFRTKDVDNTMVLRVRSMGTSSPEMLLVRVMNGTELVLKTWTGAGLSATVMNSELEWGVAVEDLEDQSAHTKITAYLGAASATDKGTEVFTWTGNIYTLRGNLGCGVEISGPVAGDDVRVDDLRVWDRADEWNPSGPAPAPGSGWQVEFGDKLYSLEDLAALDPPVALVDCIQGYGLGGNKAVFRVDGDYRIGSVVFPGQRCKVLHDGAVRFRGRIGSADNTANVREGQLWTAKDGWNEATHVRLLEDDCTSSHHFNVYDKESERYDPDRVNKTGGDVIEWLLNRYLDKLRSFEAAPPDSLPYVPEELDKLAYTIPDVVASATVPAGVEAILRYAAHRYQTWWDPDDQVLHLRDTVGLPAEVLELTAGSTWIKFKIKPDRDKAATYVEVMGARPERDDDLVLKASQGDIKPAWTETQQSKFGIDKRNRTLVIGNILSAGTAVSGILPSGLPSPYFDIKAGLLDEDDVKGWVAYVDGDFLPRIVIKNTSTRVWLDLSDWAGGTPPTAGARFSIRALDPEAAAQFSAMQVGQLWSMGSVGVQICGAANAVVSKPLTNAGQELHNRGFCGHARAKTQGADGSTYTEDFLYHINIPTQRQVQAGFCDLTATLSEAPKPSVGLMNRLPPRGGSPPKPMCEQGQATFLENGMDLELVVSRTTGKAPYLREPPEPDTYYGYAFSDDPANWSGGGSAKGTDWDVRHPYILSMPDFVDTDEQAEGLRKAAKDVLAVKSQKPIMLEIEMATPWTGVPPEYGNAPSTSTWAGLGKRVKLREVGRDTGLDDDTLELVVYAVTWKVEAGKTVLRVGTPSGWIQDRGIDIAKAYNEAALQKRLAQQVKTATDFMQRSLEKAVTRIGRQQAGPIPACNVETINRQVKRVVNIEKDDEDKIRGITHTAHTADLFHQLSVGPLGLDIPGGPVAQPGRDGDAAQQAIDGPVLRPVTDPRVLFPGPPADHPNATQGQYGGVIVTDRDQDGAPPRTLLRLSTPNGPYEIRKAEDASGNYDGAPWRELVQIDHNGQAIGAPVRLKSMRQIPGGMVPMSVVGDGSTQQQLLDRSKRLAREIALVEHRITQELVAPGDTTTTEGGYPEGAPASLLSMLRVMAPNDLRLVGSSHQDPGGMVWEGPVRGEGAREVNAKMLWRILAPEMVLARVEASPGGPGTGLNGGDYVLHQGVHGEHSFLSAGRVERFHKQGVEFEDVSGPLGFPGAAPGPIAADPSNPWGMPGHRWAFDPFVPSAIGTMVALPPGAVGKWRISAYLQEDPTNPLPFTAGLDIHLWTMLQGTPWGVPAPEGNDANAVQGDGMGSGQGVYIGGVGEIPPGLRKPHGYNLAVAFASPGTGASGMTAGWIAGIDVEIAVVEGGVFVRMGESVVATEAWDHNNREIGLDVVTATEAWSREAGKVLADAVVAHESWSHELNPPLEVREGVHAVDSWQSSIKDLDESVTASDHWTYELNPA